MLFPLVTIGPYLPTEELFLFDYCHTTIIPKRTCIGTISGYIHTKLLEGEMAEFLKGCVLAALVLVPIILAHRATESLDLGRER
jgi:hypothetical protein